MHRLYEFKHTRHFSAWYWVSSRMSGFCFLACKKAQQSETFYCRAKLWTYIPLELLSHKDNDDRDHLLERKYIFSFTRISKCRLVFSPCTQLHILFLPHPPVVGGSFLKHNSDCILHVFRIQWWFLIAYRIKIPSPELAFLAHGAAASSHTISPTQYHSSQGFSNPSVLQNPLEDCLKTHVSGLHTQHFWFSESEMGPWNSAFLNTSQVTRPLLAGGPHFKNHWSHYTKRWLFGGIAGMWFHISAFLILCLRPAAVGRVHSFFQLLLLS